MGLFFDILSSINNPNQKGSVEQLGSIMNTVQQLGAARGLNASTMQTAMSALGGYIGPALKQQGLTTGNQSLDGLASQFSGAGAGAGALPGFLNPQLQQQIIQGLAQKTGISANTLQSLLPGLISAAVGFLNMGGSTSGTQGANPVLKAFLDSDHDGDTDLGDVFKFANRFLNPPS